LFWRKIPKEIVKGRRGKVQCGCRLGSGQVQKSKQKVNNLAVGGDNSWINQKMIFTRKPWDQPIKGETKRGENEFLLKC